MKSILFSVAMSVLVSLTATATHAQPRFLDAGFAQKICTGWNQTTLPRKVGRKGSGWIDSADSKGTQRVVINRRDCKGWPRVMLTIKADAQGNAKCVKGGAWDKKPFQWKFEPTTEQWADFADGFGVMKMPGIMKGFVGPYSTAMNNIGNFEIFFAMVGFVALKNKVDWACRGADMEDVNDEIQDIDRADMRDILKGMSILR